MRHVPNGRFLSVGLRTLAVVISAACTLGAAPRPTAAPELRVNAWSSTSGPYGTVWHLEIGPDGSARASISRELGSKHDERAFTVPPDRRDAIVRAVVQAEFLALPEFLGPELVSIHGPENTLEVSLDGRVRKITLHEPAEASGTDASRFLRVWRAVAAASPIKPPL